MVQRAQTICRRWAWASLTVWALVLGHSAQAQAQAQSSGAFPNRPIKWVVPFAAGGSGDTIARLLAERLGAALGQPVLIDNRGGNGSVLGTEVAAKTPADGHHWLLSNGAAITTGPLMGQVTTYRPMDDFVHVSLIGSFTNALIVRQDHPAKNLQEFLALARSQANKLSYGSAGVGSAGFLTGEMLKQLAQVQMVHIPYKGSGPALNDLLGGQTDAMFNALISSAPHIRSGRVRALAITAAARDAEFPQVPTLSEVVPGAVGDAWFGLSVPAKTPPAVVERLHQEMDKLLKTPEVKARLTELGMVTQNLGPRGFQAFLQAENKKWAPIIRAAHIKIE